MDMLIPRSVVDVCRRLQEAGFRAVVVGGAVRSLLIKILDPLAPDPKDYDVATSALPEDVVRLFPRTIPTGIAHGTVTVQMPDEPKLVEVTTFRKDGSYSDGRRPDSVEFTDDLRADLGRRDFTINAVAYDPVNKEIFDYCAGALDILAPGYIRAVGDAESRFEEDGLRMMRAARFAAQLGFEVAGPTFWAIKKKAAGVRRVSRERVRDELLKLLAGKSLREGLDCLQASGLLAEAVDRELAGSVQLPASFEAWSDIVAAVAPEHRLPAFLWPLRKYAPWRIEPILADLKLPSKIEAWAKEVLLAVPLTADAHDASVCADLTPLGARRLMVKYTAEVLDTALAIQAAEQARWCSPAPAEVMARLVAEQRERKVPLKIRDLHIDGRVLGEMGIPPGPKMGQMLAGLLERCIENPDLNDRDVLVSLALKCNAEGHLA